MRIVTLTFASCALAGLIAVTTGCASNETSRVDRSTFEQQGPIESETATLVVHGMGCPLCANNVDRQLLAVPGVTDVSIDLGSGSVTVYLAESNRPTRSQLARAVDESGFTLVALSTP